LTQVNELQRVFGDLAVSLRSRKALELPTDLSTLASLCSGALHASGAAGPLALAMLIAGSASGVTHCAAMCGPLMLAQVASQPSPVCARARALAGARFSYHAGRLVTYAALGAFAGLAGRGLVHILAASALPASLLLALAAIVVAVAAWHGATGTGSDALAVLVSRAARPLVGSKRQWGGFRLGLILGLLPCGMIYAALAVAASTASPAIGAGLMLAFGLGTVPGLVAIGTVGRALGLRFSRKLVPVPLAINAGILALLAWRAWSAS
jgi:sulfite exporter TauE/SafE